jgi:hypothetical protein
MSIQLQIEEMPGHLAAKFSGKGPPEEIWRQFEPIAERCKSANKNKLLIDAMGAYTGASLADRYFAGEKAEIFVRYKLAKVAVVVRPERLDPQRFGETAMRNRGVNARVFTSVEDAEEWLLK